MSASLSQESRPRAHRSLSRAITLSRKPARPEVISHGHRSDHHPSPGGPQVIQAAKARALAGLKAYITNMEIPTPEFVIGSYHQLWHIEKSFRMSKHDLRARPIYHRKRDSIQAHLSVVFAALAVTRLIEDRTGWSIKKFVRTTRRYRTVQTRAGNQTLTAEDPLPPDLRDALALIN